MDWMSDPFLGSTNMYDLWSHWSHATRTSKCKIIQNRAMIHRCHTFYRMQTKIKHHGATQEMPNSKNWPVIVVHRCSLLWMITHRIWYSCGRIGHFQANCFCQPQAVEPIEISYDEWIQAKTKPSYLLLTFEHMFAQQQRSSNWNSGWLLITSSNSSSSASQCQKFSGGDDSDHGLPHTDVDDVDEKDPSLSSSQHVALGSRIKSVIQHLALRCTTEGILKALFYF